jgi:hypothetical protein
VLGERAGKLAERVRQAETREVEQAAAHSAALEALAQEQRL